MTSRGRLRKASVFAWTLWIALAAGTFAHGQEARPRICVVAVHDSSLFTFCPPGFRKTLADGLMKKLPPPGDSWYAKIWNDGFRFGSYEMFVEWDGRLGFRYVNPNLQPDFRWSSLLPPPLLNPDSGVLERSRPDWEELSKWTAGVCPSGWIDPGMAREIEAEIAKQKDYILVKSVEEADLVFLVEGLYAIYQSPADGAWLNYHLNDEIAGSPRHFCNVAVAVVVPAETYRRNPVNAEELLAGRIWCGAAFHKQDLPSVVAGGVRGLPSGVLGGRAIYDGSSLNHTASPKELVRKFVKKEKWSADIPAVGPAWAAPPLPAAEAAAARPELKTGNASKTVLQAQVPAGAAGTPVFKASTTLVTVPVVARDSEGRLVPGLSASDFHIYENGVEQTIDRMISEATLFQTALMADISHSTGLVHAGFEAAAQAFARVLRPEDRLMVLSFTNRIFLECELTGDKSELARAIARMNAHGGGEAYFGEDVMKRAWDPTRKMGTRLYDAVDLAVTERFDKLPGRKALLLFTDGVDSGSRLANRQSTLARIEESDVLVYAIHFDTPMQKTIRPAQTAGMIAAHAQGAEYLQQLADHSGGRLFKAATDAAFLEAFSHIAEEMGHQYALCYYPKEPAGDGGFRRIQVTIDKPGVNIRARAGYRPVGRR